MDTHTHVGRLLKLLFDPLLKSKFLDRPSVRIGLSLLISILFFLVGMVGRPQMSGAAKIALALGEAVLAGILVSVLFQTHIARRLISGAEDLLDESRAFENARQNIQGAASALERTLEQLERIPRLDKSLEKRTPEFREVSIRIFTDFNDHSGSWMRLAERLNVGREPCRLHAWSTFIQQHLAHERSFLDRTHQVNTSARLYTQFITAFSRKLQEFHPEQQVMLFLVTAMLPDEFFNWPQSAYIRTSKDAYPYRLGRAWDGSRAYFQAMEELKHRIDVRRCILVKHDDCTPAEAKWVPCLRTQQRLKSMRSWLIHRHPYTYTQLQMLRLDGMLARHQPAIENVQNIEDFVGIEHYSFYSIGEERDFQGSSMKPSGHLLEEFAERLHTRPTDALSYQVQPGGHDQGLCQFLGIESGLLPELAMFGVRDKEVAEAAGVEWKFGLFASLYPLTESMQVRFLVGENFRDAIKLIHRLEEGAQPLLAV
jgi:hypothetical protein